MKHSIKKFSALLLCAAVLASSGLMAPPAQAADILYDDDFETIAKVGEANSCYSAQGFAAGDAYLYAAQIGDDDARAVIHRVERDTGDRELMEHGETGMSYFTNLGHCNDMDWAVIDGVEYLYVLAEAKVVVFRIEDTKLHPHAEYDLKYNGRSFDPSAMAIYKINKSRITFLFKSGYTVSMGAVSATVDKGSISVSIRCYIDVSRVKLDGKVRDFTSFTNQGMGYKDGYLFVPITGNDDEETQSHSLILTYDMSQAKGSNKIQPVDEMTFYVISEEYAGLFEIEDCGISSDGRLYFNNNGRVSSRDTKHDGVHVLADFVLEAKKEATYTVQYDGNGGTGSMASAAVALDTAITPGENTFVRDGYTFTGWKAYSTAKKQYVNLGDKAAEGDTIIFYAQWEKDAPPAPVTYTVQYDGNGGTGAMASAAVTVDTAIQPGENTFVRDGYTFTGWKAYSTAKKQYVNIGDKAAEGDTIIFYAQWEKDAPPAPATYTVQYDGNGGAGSMASAAVTADTAIQPGENTFVRDGYTFTGWKAYSTAKKQYVNLGDKAAEGDTIIFYAQWRLLGDVNGDGRLTLADVVALRMYAAGCYPVAPSEAVYLDVNGDGAVNLSDAHVLFAYVVGAI